MFDALLALGSEPLEIQFDGLLENIGHLSASAQSKGFNHLKEYAVKLFLYESLVESRDLAGYLNYFVEKDIKLN